MSIAQPRGGFPVVRQYLVATDGSLNSTGLTAANQVEIPLPPTTWFSIETDSAVRLYFSKADFDADANYLTVTSAFAGPLGIRRIWMRGVSAPATVQLVVVAKGGGQ